MKKTSVLLTAAIAFSIALTACSNDHYTSDGGEITTAAPQTIVSTTATSGGEAANSGEQPAAPAASTIIDREGNSIAVPSEINTIVSTAPSITEILCGLGAGGKIISADTYSADVAGIDASVCTLDMSSLNSEQLIALNPDVIFINGISVHGENDPYQSLKEAGINVVYIPTSSSISAIKLDIEFIAAYTGTAEAGSSMIKDIDAEVTALSAMAQKVTEKKKVYFEVSAAPYLYSCGSDTFVDEIISLCGAENIYAGESGWISNSDETVIAANPDVILTSVKYDGYDYTEISKREGWDVINAVKNDCVYQLEPNPVSRPSQNIVTGMKLIAEAIYPDIYAENA